MPDWLRVILLIVGVVAGIALLVIGTIDIYHHTP
jgi:hypothetical protein